MWFYARFIKKRISTKLNDGCWMIVRYIWSRVVIKTEA
jgi:hypothetical protein